MKLNVCIPGKTFLLGEYAVLQGNSAVIVCTKPYFEMTCLPCNRPLSKLATAGEIGGDSERRTGVYTRVHEDSSTESTSKFSAEVEFGKRSNQRKSVFHSQSPAGKFVAEYAEIFQSFDFKWNDPYSEGGFGGSTAEFLGCFKLYHLLRQQTFSQKVLYQTYLQYAYDGKGVPPSGVDLIAQAQMQEGLVYVQSQLLPPNIFSWPFKEARLLLFKTPYKLPTHEYLKNLKMPSDYTVLAKLTEQGREALEQGNMQYFVNSINSYADVLNELNLTAESTWGILQTLRRSSSILAVKGCGALGADVIAVVTLSECEGEAISVCEKEKLILKARQ